jgi:hypothetical protein
VLQAAQQAEAEEAELLDWVKAVVKEEGRSAFTARIGVNASNLGNVLAGRKKASKRLLDRVRKARPFGAP